MNTRSRTSAAGPVLILALAIAGLYLCMLLPFMRGYVYDEYDLREYFLPSRAFYSLALEDGTLGAWNPFLARGYDHHGEGQGGILHPVHLAAYSVLPVTAATVLEMTMTTPFCFVGMFLFLTISLRLNRLASVLGAALLAFSTFAIAHYPHINMLWIYGHLPWLMLALERTFRGTRPHLAAVMLGVVMASMLLLGHPQMVWINCIAAGVGVLLIMVARRELVGVRRRALLATVGLIAGILIGMAQLLPTAEYVSQSPRGKLTPVERQNFSLHPLNGLVQLSPRMFVDTSIGDTFYLPDGSSEFVNSHQEYPSYLGITVLSLLFIGWLQFHRRLAAGRARWLARITAGALVLSVLLTLGKYGAVNELLRVLPLVSQFRCPARYMALVIFGVAVIAALVVHVFDSDDDAPPLHGQRLAAAAIPCVAAVALCLWAIALTPIDEKGFAYIDFREIHLDLRTTADLLVGPALAVAVLVLIVVYVRHRSRLVLGLICALCVADVGMYSLPTILRHERIPLRPLSDIRDGRQAMADADHNTRHVSRLNEPWLAGHYMANGYLGIAPPEHLDLFNEKRDGPPENEWTDDQYDARSAAHLRLAAVEYWHYDDGILRMPNPLPRLRLVPELRRSEAPLKEAGTIDLATTALTRSTATAPFTGPPLAAEEMVQFEVDGIEVLSIRVDVRHQRLLVLADRWSADWTAMVDGEPREIIPLFGGNVRGVVVQKGDERVTMTYRSESLVAGMLFLFAGVTGLSVLALVGARRS